MAHDHLDASTLLSSISDERSWGLLLVFLVVCIEGLHREPVPEVTSSQHWFDKKMSNP